MLLLELAYEVVVVYLCCDLLSILATFARLLCLGLHFGLVIPLCLSCPGLRSLFVFDPLRLQGPFLRLGILFNLRELFFFLRESVFEDLHAMFFTLTFLLRTILLLALLAFFRL